VQHRVERIVRSHAFGLDGAIDGGRARRFLAEHGDAVAYELLTLKEADLAAKRVPAAEPRALLRLRAMLDREAGSPHRLGDLAVSGDDLRAIGFREGPALGRALRVLLDAVVDDPARNDRTWLLARAAEELP